MNTLSEFPCRVDDPLFFSDVDVKHEEHKVTFQSFFNKDIAQTNDGKYDEAKTYIKSQNGIFGYFADLFNLLTNRVYTTQKELKAMEKEYHTAYASSSDDAENYPYFDEDSCWADITFDELTGDPDYEGDRSIDLGTQCFAFKDCGGIVEK